MAFLGNRHISKIIIFHRTSIHNSDKHESMNIHLSEHNLADGVPLDDIGVESDDEGCVAQCSKFCLATDQSTVGVTKQTT